MRTIIFPLLQVRLFGFPDMVKLTKNECKALARMHLGGFEALRTETFKASCRTVDSLVRKGILDANGLTMMGKDLGQMLADEEHEAIVGKL